jgi:hypothetical protein
VLDYFAAFDSKNLDYSQAGLAGSLDDVGMRCRRGSAIFLDGRRAPNETQRSHPS